MRNRKKLVVLAVACWLVVGGAFAGRHDDEPEQVTVQHILISFGRKIPGKKVDRSKDEARALAQELFERAKAIDDPAEFTKLVEEYTDDSPPGIYVLVNDDAPIVPNAKKRRDMVARFGDVAFSLEVGEVGLAEYHGGLSPYGWHIIKRWE